MIRQRQSEIRGGVAETGIFEGILATDGEAADGHILDIAGGSMPERVPLLVSHFNDPSATAGSMTHGRRVLKETPRKLRATGQIELGGEGHLSEIRRDLAMMIEKRHVNALSVRWEERESPTRRVNLPADHFAFVHESDKTAKRWGLYFPKWRVLEGSIVAIGADSEALIQRADEVDGQAREFWARMADAAAAPPSEPLEPFEWNGASFLLPIELVRRLEDEVNEEAGDDPSALSDPADQPEERQESLPVQTRQIEIHPHPRWNPAQVADALQAAIRRRETKFAAEIAGLIEKARGRVSR